MPTTTVRNHPGSRQRHADGVRLAQGAGAGVRPADDSLRDRCGAGGRRRTDAWWSWATAASWCGEELADEPGVDFVEQTEQLGTGPCRDDVPRPAARHDGPVLILAGDSPLVAGVVAAGAAWPSLRPQRPACLLGTATKAIPPGWAASCATPTGQFRRSSRKKTPRPTERAITEVNMSTYVFRCPPTCFGPWTG